MKPDRLFFDLEFLEDGRTIDFISGGFVADDGAELYVINGEAPLERIAAHPWLPKYVVPHLPLRWTDVEWAGGKSELFLEWDENHPDYQFVFNRDIVRAKIRGFVMSRPNPELWTWYGAYDLVGLTQLFGTFADVPLGFPKHVMDLKQTVVERGAERLVEQLMPPESKKHKAILDARWNRVLHRALYPLSQPAGDMFGFVDDGHGGVWARCGPDCDMEVVRPGRVQCSCGER